VYSQSVLDVPWRRLQHCGWNVGNEDFDEKIAWLELRKLIIMNTSQPMEPLKYYYNQPLHTSSAANHEKHTNTKKCCSKFPPMCSFPGTSRNLLCGWWWCFVFINPPPEFCHNFVIAWWMGFTKFTWSDAHDVMAMTLIEIVQTLTSPLQMQQLHFSSTSKSSSWSEE